MLFLQENVILINIWKTSKRKPNGNDFIDQVSSINFVESSDFPVNKTIFYLSTFSTMRNSRGHAHTHAHTQMQFEEASWDYGMCPLISRNLIAYRSLYTLQNKRIDTDR